MTMANMLELALYSAWERPVLRYTIVVVTSTFADFWASFYFYAVAHGWIVSQAIVGFCLPFMNLAFAIWFIQAKENSDRLKLTFFSSLGMTIGATLMLLVV